MKCNSCNKIVIYEDDHYSDNGKIYCSDNCLLVYNLIPKRCIKCNNILYSNDIGCKCNSCRAEKCL